MESLLVKINHFEVHQRSEKELSYKIHCMRYQKISSVFIIKYFIMIICLGLYSILVRMYVM